MSSLPSTTTTLIGGNASSLSTPYRSTTARSEFLSSSKQMCELRSAPTLRYRSPENDSLQVAWDVWEREVFRAEKLDGRALEQRIVLFTDVSSVLWSSAWLARVRLQGLTYRLVADIVHVLRSARLSMQSCTLTALVQMMPT